MLFEFVLTRSTHWDRRSFSKWNGRSSHFYSSWLPKNFHKQNFHKQLGLERKKLEYGSATKKYLLYDVVYRSNDIFKERLGCSPVCWHDFLPCCWVDIPDQHAVQFICHLKEDNKWLINHKVRLLYSIYMVMHIRMLILTAIMVYPLTNPFQNLTIAWHRRTITLSKKMDKGIEIFNLHGEKYNTGTLAWIVNLLPLPILEGKALYTIVYIVEPLASHKAT